MKKSRIILYLTLLNTILVILLGFVSYNGTPCTQGSGWTLSKPNCEGLEQSTNSLKAIFYYLFLLFLATLLILVVIQIFKLYRKPKDLNS
jgi:hypothetical protein